MLKGLLVIVICILAVNSCTASVASMTANVKSNLSGWALIIVIVAGVIICLDKD